jgi:hypothetical protein
MDGAGFIMMDQAGHPQLPMLTESLIIPDSARMEVRVLKSSYHEIEGDVAPFKGPILRTVDKASVPYTFGEVYKQDAWFPKDLASLRDPFILHDVRGIVVEVYPFQYNPVQHKLRVYTELEVEVVADGPGATNILDRSGGIERPDRSWEAVYMNLFGNYAGNREDPPPEDGDLLVISHGPFMAAMQPFVDWKNSIGINTSMVDVGVIGNNKDSIKAYIEQVYQNSNLSFVLLVGDHNEVKTFSYQYGPSDPTYSTLTADWYPDIFVGRFSAQNSDQVTTQVERTIAYEQESHDVVLGDWNSRGLGVASNQGPGHYGEYDDEHVDLVRDELLAYGFTEVERSYDYWGTKTIITNAINKGVRIVTYTGHGGPTGWGNGGGYSNSDVHKLQNVGMLPFVSSVACNVGEFDYGECFCEAWMRATHNGEPTGGIAHYGSSIGQYWDEPMFGQGNHCKNSKYGGVDRFWMEMNWSTCGCWFGGSCCMMEICGNSGRDMFMTWICFGDPSLRLTGQPGPQTLMADGWAVPIDDPVDINFTVCPGPDYAYDAYLLLGGVSGTYPGTKLPSGVTMPLNFDGLTILIMTNLNTPVFQNFLGTLDANGEGVATFSTNGVVPLNPHIVGTKIYFCATVGKGFDLATNAKSVTIVN